MKSNADDDALVKVASPLKMFPPRELTTKGEAVKFWVKELVLLKVVVQIPICGAVKVTGPLKVLRGTVLSKPPMVNILVPVRVRDWGVVPVWVNPTKIRLPLLNPPAATCKDFPEANVDVLVAELGFPMKIDPVPVLPSKTSPLNWVPAAP